MSSRNLLSALRGPVFSATVFAFTAVAVSVGYATYSSFGTTDYAYPRTGGTTNLNATLWNKVIDNIVDVDSRVSNFSFSGGGVGIGVPSVSARLDVADSARFGSVTGSVAVAIDRPAGQYGELQFKSGGSKRWSLYAVNTTESGSNAGSDLSVLSYTDAGTPLRTNLHILRSSGNVGIGTTNPGYKLDVNGTVNSTASCLGGSCLSAWGGIVGGSYTAATTNCAAVNNPVTGSATCPSGYSAVISGRGLCDPADTAPAVTYLCVKN